MLVLSEAFLGSGPVEMLTAIWSNNSGRDPTAPQVSFCANKGLTSGYSTSKRKAAKTLKGSFVCFS